MTNSSYWLLMTIIVILAGTLLSGGVFVIAYRREGTRHVAEDVAAQTARREAAETYSSMVVSMRELSKRIDELETGRERDHQTMLAMSSRIGALETGVIILTRQIKGAGLEPEWKPEEAVMVPLPVVLPDLVDKIKSRFNEDELADLARRLDINPDDIPGQSHQRRAAELVDMAQRRGLTGQLIMVCRELRPRTKW